MRFRPSLGCKVGEEVAGRLACVQEEELRSSLLSKFFLLSAGLS